MATQCMVRCGDKVNQYLVEVKGSPPFTVEIPPTMLFTQIREIVITRPEITRLSPPEVREMVVCVLFGLHYDRTHTRSLTTLGFTQGGGVTPNINVGFNGESGPVFKCNVKYMTNPTTTVDVDRVDHEDRLNVQRIMTQLEQKIKCPRPHLMALMAMIYGLCCLHINHIGNVTTFTEFCITD